MIQQEEDGDALLRYVRNILLATAFGCAALIGSAPCEHSMGFGGSWTAIAATSSYGTQDQQPSHVSFETKCKGKSPPADVGCMTKNCATELLEAWNSPRGRKEILCLNTCGPNDTGCQMKCVNMHEDPTALKDFTSCVVGKHRCLPQRNEVGLNWVPPPNTLVQSFNLEDYLGHWYITHGMNQVLDCFPSQEHQWVGITSNTVQVDIAYEVESFNPRKPVSNVFYQRDMSETFFQSLESPGLMKASGETDLHQNDDWYILGANKEKGYMIVYYIGCNDAWCGYNGGNVYSRTPALSEEAKKEVEAITSAAGINFNSMCAVDHKKILLLAEDTSDLVG